MKAKILMLLFALFPLTVFAHPGGLDNQGCHYCWTNCEEKYGIPTGNYHCHVSGDKSVYAPMLGETEAEPEPTSESEKTAPTPATDFDPVQEPVFEPIEELVSAPVYVITNVAEISEPIAGTAPTETPQNEPESAKDTTWWENEDGVEISDTIDATTEFIATEEQEAGKESLPPTASDHIITLAVLGGLGYGGYRGVKVVVRRIRKIL